MLPNQDKNKAKKCLKNPGFPNKKTRVSGFEIKLKNPGFGFGANPGWTPYCQEIVVGDASLEGTSHIEQMPWWQVGVFKNHGLEEENLEIMVEDCNEMPNIADPKLRLYCIVLLLFNVF